MYRVLQVDVLAEGRAWYVDPQTVRVVVSAPRPTPIARHGATTDGRVTARAEAAIPLGVDLEEALAAGLVRAIGPEQGGAWTEMEARLAELTAPLVVAGWEPGRIDYDAEWQYGASVSRSLGRDGVTVCVELYDHGQVAVYVVDEGDADEDRDGTGAPVPARVTADTEEQLRDRFEHSGWLSH